MLSKSNQIFHYTRSITPKRVTSWWSHLRVIAPGQHGFFRRIVVAVPCPWQHCVRFDRPEIWTSDLPLQKQTCYRSTNRPCFDLILLMFMHFNLGDFLLVGSILKWLEVLKRKATGSKVFFTSQKRSNEINNWHMIDIENFGLLNWTLTELKSAAWPSGTERWLLRKQYCDPSSITAAGRLLRHIRGWLETRRARAHFPVTLISPFLLSSLSCKFSVDLI